MLSSSINEILLKNGIYNQTSNNELNKDFFNSLLDTSNSENRVRTNDFSYKNIEGISLKEIDELFTNDEDRQKAKNLRLATLFTNDKHLSYALFNTVLGYKFDVGFIYLSDIYDDKSIFSKNEKSNLSSILHEALSSRFYDDGERKVTDKISQEKLDDILLAVKSFDFLGTLSKTYDDQYDKYKDENPYSFLYNDYALKYQELIHKYENMKDIDETLLHQYTY